jgi:enoyl-CoA hydratase/carnithine racemase
MTGTERAMTRQEETMSNYPDILYDVSERIATITLHRPERLNAYTAQMADSLKRAMAAANEDQGVRVIVITGAGRGFCAGADMDILLQHASAGRHTGPASPKQVEPEFASELGPDLPQHFDDTSRFFYFIRTKKPVLAAINGPIAGIGLVMALYADLRFASETAVFTTSFAQRGLIAEHGMSWLLPRCVGQSNALDLLLSARKISAREAEAMGLVNKVFGQDIFMENVRAYARNLTDTVSPRSMAIMKAQVWRANFDDFSQALAIADHEMAVSLAGSEFKEGVAHFLEKRPPRFADI